MSKAMWFEKREKSSEKITNIFFVAFYLKRQLFASCNWIYDISFIASSLKKMIQILQKISPLHRIPQNSFFTSLWSVFFLLKSYRAIIFLAAPKVLFSPNREQRAVFESKQLIKINILLNLKQKKIKQKAVFKFCISWRTTNLDAFTRIIRLFYRMYIV